MSVRHAFPVAPVARALLGALVLSSALGAQSLRAPLVPVGEGPLGPRFVVDPVAHEALRPLARVVLGEMPLPDGTHVALDLRRVRIAAGDAVVAVDGLAQRGLPLEGATTLWAGRVVDQPGSDVYLAFSPSGARGWIDGTGGLVHLVAEDTVLGRSTLVADTRLRALGMTPPGPGAFCRSESIPQPFAPASPVATGASGADGGGPPLPLLEALVAVETDSQLRDVLGSVGATQDYMAALLGAIATRYREQLGIVLTVAYLGLYAGADPWIAQDIGGGSVDVLDEFMAAWDGGAAPVAADLYHIVSGASLGGGVAYLSVVCNQDYGFAASGNLAGLVDFPVAVSPLNWDFMVVAHEWGHNFGSPHTHDFCPPLDECAPSGYFGACQTKQTCTTTGTLMSYCHLCPGGLESITTYFHPEVVSTIRTFVTSESCLQPYDGLVATDLGEALAGAAGTPSMDAAFAEPDTVVVAIASAPPSIFGTLILSPSTIDAPFKGGVLVPAVTVTLPFPTGAGSPALDLALPSGVSFPAGIDLYLQAWFADAGGPAGFSSTNAVRAALVVSDPLPPLAWIPHPSNGMEYALSHTGSYADIQAQAAGLGASLATVTSPELNAWLNTTFDPLTDKGSLLLGYNDVASEGAFAWDSGAPVAYVNWAGGEPNDFGPSGEDAAELILGAGTWNDIPTWGWVANVALLERAQSP